MTALFGAFAVQAGRRNGHGMVYAGAVCAIWFGLALWRSGALG